MLKKRKTASALALALIVSLVQFSPSLSTAVELRAHLSQHGVNGFVAFSQNQEEGQNATVKIIVNLGLDEERMEASEDNGKMEYSWGIYQFPIDYRMEDYCHSKMLGRRPLFDLVELAGGKKLELPATNVEFEIPGDKLSLLGEDSIWGRSLVLEGPSQARICANVVPFVTPDRQKIAEARFVSKVGGSVWFSSLSTGDKVETKIYSNLLHLHGKKSTAHYWKLFITDSLAGSANLDLYGGNCDFLQILFDPKHASGSGADCSEEKKAGCPEGDLSAKFGKVKIGKQESMFTKGFFTDVNLELPEFGTRSVFLVLYDAEHPDSFFTCAHLRNINTREAKATFDAEGVKGSVDFIQLSPFHPTQTLVNITGLDGGASGYHVHEFPVPQKSDIEDNPCGRTGGHFNPFRIDASASPLPGSSSMDKYEVGDLSGKYGTLKTKNEALESHVDPNLSLFGELSVIGRSIVIHQAPIPTRWLCANIEQPRKTVITAVATYTYPIAGQIIFKQDAGDQFADTQIFVESLLYSDGTKNRTYDHRWHVHVDIPGKDYFNWTGRCLSAGGHFNPFHLDTSDYNDCSNGVHPLKCELGDLSNKHKVLEVAGKAIDASATRAFFTDENLPLSGPLTIIGRSLVLHDDKAPEHRGNRMACTPIMRRYRHRAVARTWFGNGVPPPVEGRVEFLQDGPKASTYTFVDLKSLDGVANAYHVHKIPVQDHLEFPCTGDVIGGHFNPWKLDPTTSPKPTKGTSDQYEMGDLSGKYGLLRGLDEQFDFYNDTNLHLFGPNSIVGRSIVIHKKERAARWACASVGWGFDPDEATEVKAIASFHHPDGFAWGYVRFSQVVYRDGSATDTNILVRLKYPGKRNTDVSYGHDWSIYVNPVGHDAAVKHRAARCTAAGYRWNPTLIQLADPNDHGFYTEQCSKDQPFRCEVGDLSGRQGPINLGENAYVFNDVNLPLHGDWFKNAVGKSVVIHAENGGNERMACANIELDKDIVKSVKIETRTRFNLATFIEEIQAVMGVPEWFLYADSRDTKSIHGGRCVQVMLHFTGPHANRLEQDFARLLRVGKQPSPSIPIPGHVPDPQRKTSLGYRECNADKIKNSLSGSSSSYSLSSATRRGPDSRLWSFTLSLSSSLLTAAGLYSYRYLAL